MRAFPVLRRLLLLALCAGFLLGPATLKLSAETRTLTDKQGRSLKAELVSLDGDTLTIKREDGQTFALSLATLSDDDQSAVKTWAAAEAAKPKPLPPGALTVELNRGMFDSQKQTKDAKLTNGGTVKNGMTITDEKWGYTLTLFNHTRDVINNLHADYRLFTTPDENLAKSGKKTELKKSSYKGEIPAIPALSRLDFRTETISAIRVKLNGNIVFSGTGDNRSRETLTGIWIRIYQGDTLVYENVMPGTLKTTETW